MHFLEGGATATIRMGPFVDATDGVSPETGLTITQADIRLSKNGGNFAQKSDTGSATHDENGWYSFSLNTTDTNTDGRLTIAINESGALPVWQDFMVVPSQVYDSLVLGTDLLDVQVGGMDASTVTATAIASNAITSAKIAASAIGATQIANSAIGANQIATGAIDADAIATNAIGAAELAADAINEIADGVWDENIIIAHNTANTAGAILDDLVTPADFKADVSNLDATISSRSSHSAADAADAVWDEAKAGHVTAGSFGAEVQDHALSSELPSEPPTTAAIADAVWDEAKAGHVGAGSFGEEVQAHALTTDLPSEPPTAAAIADAVWDEVITGAAHNDATSAGRRLRTLSEFGGYNGGVWLDTINGTAGTTDFENGVDHNPVDTITAAMTLAGSLGLSIIRVAPGSTVTLDQAINNMLLVGSGWTLALNGQSIVGSTFIGATVSGVGSGVGTKQRFVDCTLGAVTLIKNTYAAACAITGTQTAGEAGDYFYDSCYSAIAGTATPTFDFGALIGNTNLNMRNYSGGIQVENMGDTGTDTMALEGRGQFIEGTCTGGTVSIRGLFTTSGITNLTLSDDARYATADVVDAVWDEDVINAHNTANTAGATLDDVATPDNYKADVSNLDATISSRSSHSAADAADAVWDEDVVAAHNTADTAGALIDDLGTPADFKADVSNLDATISSRSSHSAADILTSQLTETYAADGVAPTLTQALMMIQQMLGDFSISGTTLTVKEIDGTTTAATYTLNDATNPTSLTRAT